MRPAANASAFYLDDGAVLLNEQTQNVYALSNTCALVWCLLEEGASAGEILAQLAMRFGLSESEASEILEQSRALFESIGVLSGFELEPVLELDSETGSKPCLPDNAGWVAHRFHCELMTSHFSIELASAKLCADCRSMFSHLEVDGPSDGTGPEHEIHLVEQEGKTHLYLNRQWHSEVVDSSRIMPALKSLVWGTALEDQEFFIDIHAGVISDGATAIVFPAASGSGKSTLIAMLAHAGFEFFSDEMALFTLPDMLVMPVPLGICVKTTGTDVLSALYPHLTTLPLHQRPDGKRVRYLPPPPHSLVGPEARRAVGAVVFPEYRAGQSTSMMPLSHAETVALLFEQCLVVKTRLNRDTLNILMSWLVQRQCFRLVVGDDNRAVERVAQLFRQLSSATV